MMSSDIPLRERRVSLVDMIRTKPSPIDMVLDGLPLGALGVILGSGGVGKSIMMIHIGHAVTTGNDTLGCLLPELRVTQHGRVVYLAGEDDEQIVHHRVHAFGKTMSQEVAAAMQARFEIVPLVGTAPTLLNARGEINDDAIESVRVAASGTRLLIIDPLRQFHAGDENDNGMMTTLSKVLAKVAHEERCAIILVHHISKGGAKDEDADAAASRGASALTDNARWVLALRKLSERTLEDLGLDGPAWRYVSTRLVKANYAALGDASILSRGDGGILAPAHPLLRDPVAEAVSLCGATLEAAGCQPGYEDKDLFG
jgi:RecA-family ATPase